MKKILMVAYHYPPEGGSSGVLRTLKFSKYLPQHGWIPHILTVRESFYTTQDKGLVRDIPPEAVVHRTFALDSAYHFAIQGRYLSLFAIPDRFVSWLPFAVGRGLRVVRSQNISVLYSTCPPPTTHLIAAVLKALTGLPWIADFRDPWIEEGIHPPAGTLRYWIESALERRVLHYADRLIVTTPHFRRELLARYPDLPPGKVSVVYNGYDENDFQSLPDPTSSNRFEMIHAGLVTPEFRNPFPLLEVVAALIAAGDLPRDDIRVTFLGGSAYVSSSDFTAAVKRLGLDDVVEVAPRSSHREALQRLRQAAVLLLLQASEDTRTLIPAKAFEYLRVGRPILALVLDGATSDLLEGMGHCYVVDPADHTRLRSAVMSLYELWQQPSEKAQVSRPIGQFDRSNLTAELATLLEETVGVTTIPPL